MSAAVDIVPQHQLSAVGGLSEDMARARLMRVVWAAPRDESGKVVGAPGLHDLRGTQRTMIVNDLTRHGIRCRIRLTSLDLLRERLTDPTATEIKIKGPTEASYVAGDMPWQYYTLTDEWQEYPAIFASWLDYRRAEDRTLGAGFVAMRRVKDVAPGGEVVTKWQEYSVRAVDMFAFSMPGDRLGQDTPVAVPGQFPETSEVAQLQAELAELRRMIVAQAPAPVVTAPLPVYTETYATNPGATEAPTYDMAGGAFIAVTDRTTDYDDDDAGDVSEAELAKVVAATAGSVKGRNSRR